MSGVEDMEVDEGQSAGVDTSVSMRPESVERVEFTLLLEWSKVPQPQKYSNTGEETLEKLLQTLAFKYSCDHNLQDAVVQWTLKFKHENLGSGTLPPPAVDTLALKDALMEENPDKESAGLTQNTSLNYRENVRHRSVDGGQTKTLPVAMLQDDQQHRQQPRRSKSLELEGARSHAVPHEGWPGPSPSLGLQHEQNHELGRNRTSSSDACFTAAVKTDVARLTSHTSTNNGMDFRDHSDGDKQIQPLPVSRPRDDQNQHLQQSRSSRSEDFSTAALEPHTSSVPANGPTPSTLVLEAHHVEGFTGARNKNVNTGLPDDLLSPSPVPEPQHVQEQMVEQESSSSSEAGSTPPDRKLTCSVPVGHFWYLNQIYKKEIEQILTRNRVRMKADLSVTFEENQEGGKQENAVSVFTDLMKKCSGETTSADFHFKDVKQEGWDNIPAGLEKSKKLLFTVSSEEILVWGPPQDLDAIKNSWKVALKTTNTPNIIMNISDPLLNDGLTMEQSQWKLMTTSYVGQVSEIEKKYGVDFQTSEIDQGRVKVKPCYKGSGGNSSMESHASRALLKLHQRISTHFNATHPLGDTDSLKSRNNADGSEQDEERAVLNGQSNSTSTVEGATAGDNKDDTCPICLDLFTNKKQLKCKHEFCQECLESSENSMGPACPVCKDVYGVIEGDQPDGNMSWNYHSHSLPGFPDFGTIVINYQIPSGRQTKKHPNPGRFYPGIQRTAFLPDNQEGNEVVRLLKKAFDQKLIFTIGTSRTTGMDNQVTWNDIHHKTSITGGSLSFGYPDPDYLSRVKEELKAKGIV